MPSRGRSPKPVAIHHLEGTYKPSRHDHRAREPQADGERAAYPAPAWKSDNQRRLWTQRLADVLKGPLRLPDRQVLTNCVALADRFERAAIAGCEIVGAGAGARNACGSRFSALRTKNQATLLMNTLQAEQGFTLTARAQLGVLDLPGGEPASQQKMFDTILPDGKVVPYGRR